ncbi:replicative DNA helicase [Escherichia coli]|uniref:Replicative DNA helicase n=1 Tax=Escherichia coli TaxID=562 RepID=A0A2X1JJ80_ECOLX|nr:replicative DNA helicase [Escherichia coli]
MNTAGIGLIMIDYLQLMRVPALSDNRTLEIAEISRSLKALAKELNVPVGGAVPVEPFSGTTCRQTPGQLRPAWNLALSSRMRT